MIDEQAKELVQQTRNVTLQILIDTLQIYLYRAMMSNSPNSVFVDKYFSPQLYKTLVNNIHQNLGQLGQVDKEKVLKIFYTDIVKNYLVDWWVNNNPWGLGAASPIKKWFVAEGVYRDVLN